MLTDQQKTILLDYFNQDMIQRVLIVTVGSLDVNQQVIRVEIS